MSFDVRRTYQTIATASPLASVRNADGVTWDRDESPALDVGEPGAWDAWAVDTPAVVEVDGLFYLYHFGQRESGTTDGGSIGLATFHDGRLFLRPAADPVLEPGPPGAWDDRWVESPSVIYDDRRSRWTMGAIDRDRPRPRHPPSLVRDGFRDPVRHRLTADRVSQNRNATSPLTVSTHRSRPPQSDGWVPPAGATPASPAYLTYLTLGSHGWHPYICSWDNGKTQVTPKTKRGGVIA